MPIPTPGKTESRETFVSRCMTALKDDYQDQDQRLAVCFSAWRRAKKEGGTIGGSAVRQNITFPKKKDE